MSGTTKAALFKANGQAWACLRRVRFHRNRSEKQESAPNHPPDRARLAALIERNSIPEPNTGCHLWLGTLNHDGYGKVWDSANQRRIAAHRGAYIVARGPISEGFQLDHLCRQRSCVAVAHLEAVTPRENLMRSTSHVAKQAQRAVCLRGHDLAGENLYIGSDGHRHCRICQHAKSREHYLRNAERVKARSKARRERLAKTATATLLPGGAS